MLSSVGHKAISATQRAVSQSSGRRIARVARKERGSAASRNVASFARPNAKLASPLATSNKRSTPANFASSAVRGYATVEPFKLADIGEGIAEVELIQWFVKEGDRVEEFDKVCEVQSDKATVEIKAPKDGIVLKLYHAVGAMAKVGQPLVDLSVESSNETIAASVASPKNPHAAPTPASSAPSTASQAPQHGSVSAHFSLENQIVIKDGKSLKVLATPAVRHLAYQNKISLSLVQGSGKDGRVTKSDLLDVMSGKKPLIAAGAASSQTVSAASVHSASRSSSSSNVHEDRVEKLKGYNKAMVKKMNESLQIPVFGYCDDVLMDELVKLRKELKQMAEKRGVKLSYMPFIIKACSLGLKKFPILNSSLSADQTEVIYRGSHNIGVAVDTPTGLVVPNIKNVQDLTLFEIAEELNRLVELAKINKLSTQDLSGGTFSLSNIGAIGGTYAKPVVVSPEVCIGAIGKMQTLPRFDAKGAVYPANITQFSWSADHRVVDGASMANFFNLVKFYLEHPASMIMDTK